MRKGSEKIAASSGSYKSGVPFPIRIRFGTSPENNKIATMDHPPQRTCYQDEIFT